MPRLILFAMLLCTMTSRPSPAQEPEPIGKALNLGTLAEAFSLVSGTMECDGAGCKFTLKLEAKKDVDTADLFCQVGFFDKSKQLLLATPLVFQAGFPLKTGESIQAYFFYQGVIGEDGVPWRVIAIRPARRPN